MLSASPIRTPTKKKVKSRSSFSILSPVICSGRRRREERAVYEAASTFIGSGFEELEYDPSESERFARVSVMFLTGKMLVRLALKEKHGWKRAADMSRLVLGDTVIEESGAGVVAWMQRMQLTTLAVTAHKISGAAGYLDVMDSDEMADTVSDYLAQGMFAANHELQRSDANWLLKLIILSLSRLSLTQPVNQGLAPGLVLMATIVGHVAGRMEEMMKGLMKRECAIITCYNEAKQTLSNI